MGLRSRLRQYIGLAGMERRLELLLQSYAFGSVEKAFAGCMAGAPVDGALLHAEYRQASAGMYA